MRVCRIWQLVAGAIILASFTGCATQAQRRAQEITANNQTAVSQLQACLSMVYFSPEAEPVRRHIPLKIQDATLEQLTDPAKATDDEIKAIYLIHPRLQGCRRAALERLATSTPTLVPIIADAYQKNELSVIDLLQRKIIDL